MKANIKYINHGVACNISGRIYINKRLKLYPELLDAILSHEKAHSDNFGLRDILIDFEGKHLKMVKKEYYKFILMNPSSWTMFLPIAIYDRKLVYDPVMIFLWIMIILTIIII